MTKKIPQIPYKTNYSGVEGIEIITLESLMNRKEDIEHSPEKAHQLDFYILLFFSEGETEHLVDFVWHKIRKNTLLYLTKGQINAFKFNKSVKGYSILFTEDYFKSQLNKLPENVITRLFSSHLFSPKVQVPESSNVANYMHLLHHEFYHGKDEFTNSCNRFGKFSNTKIHS